MGKISRFLLALAMVLAVNSCSADYNSTYSTTLTSLSQSAANNIFLLSHTLEVTESTFYGTEEAATVWFNEKCVSLEAEDFAPSARVEEGSTGVLNLIATYTSSGKEKLITQRDITFFPTI